MADPDKGSDIDRLLAEVESTLGGSKPSSTPARTGGRATERRAGGLTEQVSVAALTGAVAAGAVFVAFALLPFLGAFSGAAGAFLATFVAALLLRRR